MKKFIFLFFLSVFVFSNFALLGMPMPPTAPVAEPVEATPAMPEATAPSMPAMVTPAPTGPVVTQMPAPTSPAPTVSPEPSTSPAPTQLKFPETGVRLKEEVAKTQVEVSKISEEQITQVKDTLNKIEQSVEALILKRNDFENKYKETDVALDNFLRETSSFIGEQEAKIKEFEETNKSEQEKLLKYKQDLRQLKEKMETIDRLESDLLTQLKQLNDKIGQSIDLSVSARKLSISLLDKTTATEPSFEQFKKQLAEIQAIKQDIETKLWTSFDSMATKIKTDMQKVQEDLKNLVQQGNSLGLPVPVVKTEPEKKEGDIKSPVTELKKESKGFFFNLGVNIVAGGLSFIKKISNWFAGLFAQTESSIAATPEPEKQLKEEPKSDVQVSAWRQTSVFLFNKLLDGISFVAIKIKNFSIWFYEKFLEKFVSNFVKAVKTKTVELEKKDTDKQLQVQQPEPVSVAVPAPVPAMPLAPATSVPVVPAGMP